MASLCSIAATFPELCAGATGGDPRDNGEAAARLGAIVERGIENAVRLDIGDGPDIAAFIALGLALRLAPPGEAAWIHDYMNRLGTSGPTKLRMIESQLRARGTLDNALSVIARRVAQARDRVAP